MQPFQGPTVFETFLLATTEVGESRPVRVDEPSTDPEQLLDQIFENGQNEFQPLPGKCSVSVGDVISLQDKLFMVAPVGFRLIDSGFLETYKKTPLENRGRFRFDLLNTPE